VGRPGKRSELLFTTRELALAASLTPRNMALLHDKRLAPESTLSGSDGQGGHRLYDSPALAHAALIGALHLAGFELLVSARLAGDYAEEEGHIRGKLHSNLASYIQAPFNPRPGYRPFGPEVDLSDDYSVHCGLMDSIIDYRPGVAIRGDMIIDIADHEFVLTETHDISIRVFSPVGTEGMVASPDYRIVGRGSAATIVPVIDEVDTLDFEMDPASAARYKALQEDYLRARENAVARVRVNVSLAIRNAFDRIRLDRTRAA